MIEQASTEASPKSGTPGSSSGSSEVWEAAVGSEDERPQKHSIPFVPKPPDIPGSVATVEAMGNPGPQSPLIALPSSVPEDNLPSEEVAENEKVVEVGPFGTSKYPAARVGNPTEDPGIFGSSAGVVPAPAPMQGLPGSARTPAAETFLTVVGDPLLSPAVWGPQGSRSETPAPAREVESAGTGRTSGATMEGAHWSDISLTNGREQSEGPEASDSSWSDLEEGASEPPQPVQNRAARGAAPLFRFKHCPLSVVAAPRADRCHIRQAWLVAPPTTGGASAEGEEGQEEGRGWRQHSFDVWCSLDHRAHRPAPLPAPLPDADSEEENELPDEVKEAAETLRQGELEFVQMRRQQRAELERRMTGAVRHIIESDANLPVDSSGLLPPDQVGGEMLLPNFSHFVSSSSASVAAVGDTEDDFVHVEMQHEPLCMDLAGLGESVVNSLICDNSNVQSFGFVHVEYAQGPLQEKLISQGETVFKGIVQDVSGLRNQLNKSDMRETDGACAVTCIAAANIVEYNELKNDDIAKCKGGKDADRVKYQEAKRTCVVWELGQTTGHSHDLEEVTTGGHDLQGQEPTKKTISQKLLGFMWKKGKTNKQKDGRCNQRGSYKDRRDEGSIVDEKESSVDEGPENSSAASENVLYIRGVKNNKCEPKQKSALAKATCNALFWLGKAFNPIGPAKSTNKRRSKWLSKSEKRKSDSVCSSEKFVELEVTEEIEMNCSALGSYALDSLLMDESEITKMSGPKQDGDMSDPSELIDDDIVRELERNTRDGICTTEVEINNLIFESEEKNIDLISESEERATNPSIELDVRTRELIRDLEVEGRNFADEVKSGNQMTIHTQEMNESLLPVFGIKEMNPILDLGMEESNKTQDLEFFSFCSHGTLNSTSKMSLSGSSDIPNSVLRTLGSPVLDHVGDAPPSTVSAKIDKLPLAGVDVPESSSKITEKDVNEENAVEKSDTESIGDNFEKDRFVVPLNNPCSSDDSAEVWQKLEMVSKQPSCPENNSYVKGAVHHV